MRKLAERNQERTAKKQLKKAEANLYAKKLNAKSLKRNRKKSKKSRKNKNKKVRKHHRKHHRHSKRKRHNSSESVVSMVSEKSLYRLRNIRHNDIKIKDDLSEEEKKGFCENVPSRQLRAFLSSFGLNLSPLETVRL